MGCAAVCKVPVTSVASRLPVNVVAVIAPETFTLSRLVCPSTSKSPDTLSDVNVPTDVSEELTTLDPSVVAERISTPLILKVLLEARSIFSENVQESVESTQLIVLFPSPDSSVIPPPSEDASVREPLARIIFLSSTVKVVEFTVVVSPST